MMRATPGGILAAYQHVDAASEAITALKRSGYEGFTVYSPAPNEELF